MKLADADLLTAIVTPFDDAGQIDFTSLKKLTNYLIDQGSNGFDQVSCMGAFLHRAVCRRRHQADFSVCHRCDHDDSFTDFFL